MTATFAWRDLRLDQGADMAHKHVVVIGGGISGLATAYFLKQKRPDWHVTLFEKEAEVGGKVRSSLVDGFTVDWGPNGFLTNAPETLELAKSLGLEGELQEASDVAKQRFLYKNGGLRPLPLSPPAFLTSELLSPVGKVRALLEPLLGKHVTHEETVYDFIQRHFGHQVADTFAEALALGITAGDAKSLSLDALFPRLRKLEEEHGSLLRAMIAAQKQAKEQDTQKGRLTSFKHGGIGRLIEALQEQLQTDLRTGEGVLALEPQEDGYQLKLESGEVLHSNVVVLTTPAPTSASLLRPFLLDAALQLSNIPYADMRVFGLGYDRIDIPNALDGFGFLVPRGEGLRALGVLYSSSIFPSQAPKDKVLLRVICGGWLDPEFANLSSDEALSSVCRDLEVSLGITAEPLLVQEVVWKQGIPQYLLGHPAHVARIMELSSSHANLYLSGNAFYGVGVNDCVREAQRTVKLMLER